VKGNVTQTQVDNWCRRNAGINLNRGNAWGRDNNTNKNSGQGADSGDPVGNQHAVGPEDKVIDTSTNGQGRTSNNGQGPVNAQGNAYAWGWYANKDEYRTPPGKSRGKGTTGLKEPKIYFYHGDHLGSANYVTDVIGEVFEHTINFPFGEIWIDEGSNTSLLGFKFTGKELDEETGYIYFGARYYDPKVSVWVSTDPILGEYLPQGNDVYFPEEKFDASKLKGAGGIYNFYNLNMYHYAGLNPIKNIDPNGKWTFQIGIKMEGFIFLGGSYEKGYAYSNSSRYGSQHGSYTTTSDVPATHSDSGGSIAITVTFSMNDSIEDLSGKSVSINGTRDTGILAFVNGTGISSMAGGSVNFPTAGSNASPSITYENGASVSFSPVDMGASVTNTTVNNWTNNNCQCTPVEDNTGKMSTVENKGSWLGWFPW